MGIKWAWLVVMAAVYLDYNATTPLDPTVLEAITDSLTNLWGNPSSSYPVGEFSTVGSSLSCTEWQSNLMMSRNVTNNYYCVKNCNSMTRDLCVTA